MSEHGVCLLTGVTCTDEAGLEVAIFKLYTHDCNFVYNYSYVKRSHLTYKQLTMEGYELE